MAEQIELPIVFLPMQETDVIKLQQWLARPEAMLLRDVLLGMGAQAMVESGSRMVLSVINESERAAAEERAKDAQKIVEFIELLTKLRVSTERQVYVTVKPRR